MIVEDDHTLRTVVGDFLRAGGFRVAQFPDGLSARDALRGELPDVLVLDRMLPGVSGDELCRQARAASDQLPIIMLTALDAVEDRIDGLEHGADDYVTKPFALRELQLRISATLRRTRAAEAAPYTVGRFRVEPGRRRVWLGEREIALTAREYELLFYLTQHPDRVVSRDEILREVWGWSFGDPATVTVHVRRLREKIECDPGLPQFLLTEWGAGYRFTPAAESTC
ncbi:response regulator transcription factor [Protaetiibacter sp. 10F1B-8-1]|uniref:Response regulator transcription factor n=2 Tax=Protaetiibacter mangrovi TaxID=2970926 RepID=A0ABT1ZCW9_9MICO|nr:response regulator transcription factor [Protaetiibacter mangrovi]